MSPAYNTIFIGGVDNYGVGGGYSSGGGNGGYSSQGYEDRSGGYGGQGGYGEFKQFTYWKQI